MRAAASRDRLPLLPDRVLHTEAQAALAALPLGVLVLDADGRPCLVTPRLRAILEDVHIEPAPRALLPPARTTDGRSVPSDHWPVHETLRTGRPIEEVTVELARRDGSTRALRLAAHPYPTAGDDRPGAIMLVEDVTARREREILRDDFLSILGHELRTPITTIYSAVHLLRGGRLEPEVREELVDDVATQADALHRIIEDLLVMTRTRDPRGAVEIEPVLVRRVVDLALNDAVRHWPEVDFRSEVPRRLPAVRADEIRLHQVLRNLLANAVKYGGPRGTVCIRADAGDGAVVIRVEDDGPGIPVELRERVFELFFRAPGRTDVGGSGIGLYVVRRLVEAMDGRVWVAERAGGGTAIALTLPVLDEPPEPWTHS